MMDFDLTGNVNFNTKDINADIDVIFMKDHSKFIKHIPILGYIIAGEDDNFVTQVNLYGSIDNPEFETHTVKNAAEGTLNVLKRIITLPLLPFQDMNLSKEDKARHKRVVDEFINSN
jgi:hypothetical protein